MIPLLIILAAVIIVSCLVLVRRNNQVYKTQITVLSRISDLAKADIEAGRPWEWRYAGFQSGPSYDAMVLKFWKPLDSFYQGVPYLEDIHV